VGFAARRSQQQRVALLAGGCLAKDAAENCRRQPGHRHVGNHDLGRLAQRLLEAFGAAVDQHRQMTETFDLCTSVGSSGAGMPTSCTCRRGAASLAVLFGAGCC
jgi:hypothetical protein